MDSQPASHKGVLDTNFSPLFLLSIVMLVFVFATDGSPMFRIGIVGGRLTVSVALALPVFLILRYATAFGGRWSKRACANAGSLLVSVAFICQTLLALFVPSAISALSHASPSASIPQPASEAAIPSPVGLSLKDIRAKYPMYNDWSDHDLSDAVYEKYYPGTSKKKLQRELGFWPGEAVSE